MLLRNFDRRFKNRGDASPLSPRKERSARNSYRQLIDFRAVRQYLFFREHVLDRLLSLLDVLHVLVSLHHRAHDCTRFFFCGWWSDDDGNNSFTQKNTTTQRKTALRFGGVELLLLLLLFETESACFLRPFSLSLSLYRARAMCARAR